METKTTGQPQTTPPSTTAATPPEPPQEKQKGLREILIGYQNELLKKELLPERAAKILTEISALLGNINDKIVETEFEYSKELLRQLDNEQKANRAKIKAETTEQFLEKQKYRNIKELAIEMTRSLKFFLRAKGEEWGAGKNM